MRSAVLFGALALLLLSSCVFYGPNGENYVVKKDDKGWYAEVVFDSVDEEVVYLRALVKGSIYETGEAVSVFGTCLDGDDNPVVTSNATLSSWYPNGTVHLSNQSMTKLQDGYFLWTGTMDAVKGTYLTELTCVDSSTGAVARAFGEWQNPYWVHKISLIKQSLGNLTVNINDSSILEAIDNLSQNITITIGNLEVDMNESFEITWDKIESVNQTINVTYTNLSQQIYYVGQIANASVDRNDSYIVELILNLTGLVVGGNYTGLLVNWTEIADTPVYWSDWEIRVDTYDPNTGDRLTYPDSLCTISTTLTPSPQSMDPVGNHFIYEEFINSGGDFSWNVSCVFA